MTITRRFIVTTVGLVLLACCALGATFAVTTLLLGGRALDDNALVAANLVAHVADEEPATALTAAVVPGSDILAAGLYDRDFQLLRQLTTDGHADTLPAPDRIERIAAGPRRTAVQVTGDRAVAVAPVTDGPVVAGPAASAPVAFVAVVMSTTAAEQSLKSVLAFGLATTLVVTAAAAAIAYVSTRRLVDPLSRLTAAAESLEHGEFEAAELAAVSARSDELGQLATRFASMAEEVQARERELALRVATLQVEIDEKARSRTVAEITGTEAFADIVRRAAEMRERREQWRPGPDEEPPDD